MSLAKQIREIQHSESDNKAQDVAVLFEQYRKYLGLSGEWKDLFLTFKNAVCDYINTPSNIVPFAISVPNHANLFAYIFGMHVVQGGSAFYLSWSKPMNEEGSSDVESRVVDLLRAAYVNATILDVLKLLQAMLPNKGLQLFFGTYLQACHSTPGEKVVQVIEETFEKEGIYLYCT